MHHESHHGHLTNTSNSTNTFFPHCASKWQAPLVRPLCRVGRHCFSPILSLVSLRAHVSLQQTHTETLPVSLIIGAHAAITTPSTFVTSQLPTYDPADSVAPAVVILAYTLGSLFLLLAGYALTCTVLTKDPDVTRYYLLFAACGDVGHLVANYAGMGSAVFWAYREWNKVMWGNIAVTIFLFLNRIATVNGMFGSPGWVTRSKARAL